MNDEFKDILDEITEKLEDIEDKIEDIEDKLEDIEDAARDGAEDGANSALDDADFGGDVHSGMMILSQDRKIFAPFTYIEAVRIKKGEEPYSINLSLKNTIGRRIGKYPDKATALAEMEKIVSAYEKNAKVYIMN